MTNKKIFCLFLIAVCAVVALYVGFHIAVLTPTTVYYWEFAQPADQVVKIQIVDAEDECNYTVIKELDAELIPVFYEEVQQIEMKRYGWSLNGIYGKSFLIMFSNGEYDILSIQEAFHIKYTDGSPLSYCSKMLFNEESFDALMQKYLED